MTEPLKVVFMGTADLACPTLKALLEERITEVVAVVTQPDRPRGRDLKLQASAVKQLSLRHGVPVHQPKRARDPEFIQELRQYQADIFVVVAYGQILPPAILEIPRYGCLNVHASLLPKYRGAAPIQWAILNDDAETGVTIMKMDSGLDTGHIISLKKTPISSQDNAQTLHNRLAEIGASLLITTIPRYVSGELVPTPQPPGDSYARKIVKEDGRIDWKLAARTVWNRVRAFTPWPGSFTTMKSGEKTVVLKILEADPLDESLGQPGQVMKADPSGLIVSCGSGSLRILALQRESGKALRVGDFLTGNPISTGTILGG